MALAPRWLNAASWLAPPVTVLVAVGLDRWLDTLREEASATFNFAPAAWGALGANLVVAALLLLVAWLVTFRGGRTRGPATLCLILGFLLAVYPWFFVLVPLDIPSLPALPFLQDLRAMMASSLSSRSLMASAFLVLAGLAGLVFPDRRFERPAEQKRGEASL